MYDRSNVRPVGRLAATSNHTTARTPINMGPNSGSMGRSQPVPRGTTNRYEDESPPPRNAPRQQKTTGGGQGYGEYDHLYKNASRATGQPPAMPKFALCYVCGRKYGTQSIEIHEPQCLEKWHFENAKLPPNLRRPPPRKPDVQIDGGGNSLDQFNDAAYEAAKAQLIPCDNCGRKFASDRIQVHLKSCKPGHAARPIGPSGGGGGGGGGDPRMSERSIEQKRNAYNDDYDDVPKNYPTRRGGGGGGRGINGGSTFHNVGSSGNSGLYPCSVCHRNFASDRIQQHEAACMKASKQRRVFDSTKQRLQGTEAAAYFRKGKARNEPAKPQAPKSNWRQKHEDFIRSIRYAKQATNYEKAGGRLADLPPPPTSVNPDYVRCPHCGRSFAPAVAERHIPKCVNIQNKPRPPPGNNRMGAPQRVPVSNTRTPINNYNNSSNGFGNNTAYPPPNRAARGNRY
ncbi:unnamed protein product [Rotaria magnacalcarata]|uniref:C2HC/C3H-type domain-containing protein n=1 Tax=Rotaria magnacalcarata TaxID=392030 RepID=A0A816L0P9_9BILA|nr:unnamed protein product [Rotaria magnacalcarata]CAF1322745.1 unnamed protein product [Rotaria magnacalcarata]CAF1922957.1 unnamed protein product [Rotaria magnacalcarata]